ncbi:hypothetical protein, partial [Stieleria sp.]|uniref:hypothetical protein n=1 Tax=Stieleria sp. TaxID=2795976 RepID=UPI0035625B8A
DDMMRRLAATESIPNGTIRLIARIDGALDGLEISPAASQQTAQTIAIIHLKHADLPEPVADKNLVSDFRRVNRIETTTPESEDSKPDSEATDTTDNKTPPTESE